MKQKLLSLMVTLVAMFGCLSSVQAQEWTWIGEARSNGEFYVLNVYYNSFVTNYMDGKKNGKTSLNPEEAELFTLTVNKGNNSYFISTTRNEALNPYGPRLESPGDLSRLYTEQISKNDNDYHYNIIYAFITKEFLGEDGNRVLAKKNKDNGDPWRWRFISKEQMDLYKEYIQTWKNVEALGNNESDDFNTELNNLMEPYASADMSNAKAKIAGLNSILKITIPSEGYTTYGNLSSSIDFSTISDAKFKVYAATSITKDRLDFTSISSKKLYKGEGALLKGTAGNYCVATSNDATANTNNLMKAGDGKAHAGAFVLASATGYSLGFYRLNSSVIVPEGKAYIDGSSVQAKSFVLKDSEFDDGEITAIGSVKSETDNTGEMFSITGVKVNKNYRGIVIKNGVKYIQK